MKELPLALLAGDGKLVKSVMAVATQNQINVSVKVLADSFGLIIEAAQHANLSAVLPTLAANTLSKEGFMILELKGMAELRRSLSLVYDQRVVAIRDSIKRVAGRLLRILNPI